MKKKKKKKKGFFTPNPNESTIIGNVRKEMKETQSLADEKVEISEKTLRLVCVYFIIKYKKYFSYFFI